MATILVVDDEETMVRSLSVLLRREAHEVVTATTGPTAINAFQTHHPALVLLDVMLPGLDGVAVCREIRARSSIPIILLTARTDARDIVYGLDAGADDYVTKPFRSAELLARVRASLRRTPEAAAPAPERLEIGAITVEIPQRRVVVRGRAITLSPKEFDLLRCLMSQPGVVLTRDDLLDRVWGPDFAGSPDTLNVHVRWLRTKVEEDPTRPAYIRTVHGVGYRFRPRCP